MSIGVNRQQNLKISSLNMNLCGKPVASTSCLALVASSKSTCGVLSNTGLSQMSIWSHVAVGRILCSKDAAGRPVSTAAAHLHLRLGSPVCTA